MFPDCPSNLYEIAKHLFKPVPILGTVGFHFRVRDRPDLVLPPTFFEEFLSSVRTLVLYGVTLPPGPRKLSQLTNFTLSMHATGVSSTALLDALEQMPLLQVFEVELDKLGHAREQDPVPVNRVITLPHLEEVTVTRDYQSSPPLADVILPALCLPSARRVTVRLINARGFPRFPILPLSFEERLPCFSITPKVSVTFGGGFNIEFFGSHESKLTVYIDSSIGHPFTRLAFSATPFGSVRKLYVRFQECYGVAASFFGMLRTMERLEHIEMEQDTTLPLCFWRTEDDQAGICPDLNTLIVTGRTFDTVEERVRQLEQVRNVAGVPIAQVMIGRWSDSGTSTEDGFPTSHIGQCLVLSGCY